MSAAEVCQVLRGLGFGILSDGTSGMVRAGRGAAWVWCKRTSEGWRAMGSTTKGGPLELRNVGVATAEELRAAVDAALPREVLA